jgi:hypothetical protein
VHGVHEQLLRLLAVLPGHGCHPGTLYLPMLSQMRGSLQHGIGARGRQGAGVQGSGFRDGPCRPGGGRVGGGWRVTSGENPALGVGPCRPRPPRARPEGESDWQATPGPQTKPSSAWPPTRRHDPESRMPVNDMPYHRLSGYPRRGRIGSVPAAKSRRTPRSGCLEN